jgi:hypothetical protein
MFTRILRERGCDEVVLHNDDIMALFTRQREKAERILYSGLPALYTNSEAQVGVRPLFCECHSVLTPPLHNHQWIMQP